MATEPEPLPAAPEPEPWPVLVATGDSALRTSLIQFLRAGYRGLPAENSEQVWRLLRHTPAPRLAVAGRTLTDLDGFSLCRKLRERRRLYVVLVTGEDGAADAAALEAGADDCLRQPFTAAQLHMRLRSGRRIVELREQLRHARDALRFNTTHDGLTGVWNRESIGEALERELARALRHGKPLGILKADIRGLREINQRFGRAVADSVLQEVARRLREAVRCYDAVGRFGAQEFLVVLPEILPADLLSVAARLCARISSAAVSTSAGPIDVALSIGASGFGQTAAGFEGHQLLRAAEVALYLSQRSGRHCVRICGAENRVLFAPALSTL